MSGYSGHDGNKGKLFPILTGKLAVPAIKSIVM